MSAPKGHVSGLSRLRGRGLFLAAVLLALAPGLGGCTEEKEPPLEVKPAAATGVEAGEAGTGGTAKNAGNGAGSVAGDKAGENAGENAEDASGDVSGKPADDAPAREPAKDADATAPDNADPKVDETPAGESAGESAEASTPNPTGDAATAPADSSEEPAPQQADNELAEDGSTEDEFTEDELTAEERLEVAKSLWPPVKSLVTAPFGERRGSVVPLLSDAPMKPRSHGGIDLRGHLGWPVRSLEDGTVVAAGPGGNAGLMVRIRQADGKSVSYAHLGEVYVKGGDTVKKGQHIGEVGCTGRTTGAHLHISVRDEKGKLLDPENEIEGLWDVYDPPLADLREPIDAQSCGSRSGGANPRLRGQQQYLRMRKALLENEYKVPDAVPAWEDRDK